MRVAPVASLTSGSHEAEVRMLRYRPNAQPPKVRDHATTPNPNHTPAPSRAQVAAHITSARLYSDYACLRSSGRWP
jgi:hypothetical protein